MKFTILKNEEHKTKLMKTIEQVLATAVSNPCTHRVFKKNGATQYLYNAGGAGCVHAWWCS